MQLHGDVGFGAVKLGEQELPEQCVVAIPLAPAIERDEEQVRGLELAKLRVRVRRLENGVAQRARELVEHRGAPQEPLGGLRELFQRHAVEVVGDVAIVAGHRVHVRWALLRDQRGEVEPDRPSLGALGHRGRQLGGEVHLGLREDVLGGRRVEGQVACSELEGVTRGPKPGQVRLLGAARRDELRAARNG